MSEPTAIADAMYNPQLRLLNALRNGSKPIMTFMGLPSFRAAQMVAQTGLDVGLRPRQYPVISR
jgi:4-hydroxy-2-oxoheptanedioate aldolase